MPRASRLGLHGWVWSTACGLVAYAALAIWWNAGALTDASEDLSGVSAQVKAELGVVNLADGGLPASFEPDGNLMPQVTVGPYRKAVAEFGSPTPTRTGADDRYGAVLDAMLLRGRPIEVSSAPQPAALLMLGKGCQRSALGPYRPSALFALTAAHFRHHCPSRYEHCLAGQVLCSNVPRGTSHHDRPRKDGRPHMVDRTDWGPLDPRGHAGSPAGCCRLGRHRLSGQDRRQVVGRLNGPEKPERHREEWCP